MAVDIVVNPSLEALGTPHGEIRHSRPPNEREHAYHATNQWPAV